MRRAISLPSEWNAEKSRPSFNFFRGELASRIWGDTLSPPTTMRLLARLILTDSSLHYFFALRLVTKSYRLALESDIQSDIIRPHYFGQTPLKLSFSSDHAPLHFSSSSGINLKREAMS
jgi:hypothetical protein